MATKIQFRRDTAANWASTDPILSQGELGLDLTNNILKIGDGTTSWNTLTAASTTEVYVNDQITALVDSSPAALNTLAELAAALGDDANFSTTVTNSIGTKLPKAGGTLTGNLSLGDNVKAKFGNGDDLQIYHDGGQSYIAEMGTGDLRIRGNGTNVAIQSNAGENMLVATKDGAINAYYDNSLKLATTSTGIDVTGSVTCDGASVISTEASIGGVIEITANSLTSGRALNIVSNGMTTGSLAQFYSNSSNTGTRDAVKIWNDNAAATGTTALRVIQDSTGPAAVFEGGNVGIGTSSPSKDFVVSNGGAEGIEFDAGAISNLNEMLSYNRSTSAWIPMRYSTSQHEFYTGGSERMHIDSSGNVGIGTSSPASARGIAGSVLHISDTPDAALRITDTGGSDFEISAETNTWLGTVDDTDLILGANNSERIRITNGGNVGIGTSSPSYNFEVSGGSSGGFVLRSTNSYQVGMSLRYNTNTIAARWCTHASMAGVSSTDVSSGFYVDNGQNFNIGFGTVVKMYVTSSGDLTAAGNITAYSDERIKENISEIPNALDAVDAIRGVTYTRTDTKEDGVGVIAQEVEEVFPELIHESNDGIKSVNYNGLVGVLFAAVKELSAEVKALKEK